MESFLRWNAAVVDVVAANAHEFADIYGHGQYLYNSAIGNTLLCLIHFDIYSLKRKIEKNGINHWKNRSIFCMLDCVEHI